MFVVYVTMAFVSQAAIGCALSMSELVPRWIGWATAIWNLAWLAGLVLARVRDIWWSRRITDEHRLGYTLVRLPLEQTSEPSHIRLSGCTGCGRHRSQTLTIPPSRAAADGGCRELGCSSELPAAMRRG